MSGKKRTFNQSADLLLNSPFNSNTQAQNSQLKQFGRNAGNV
jgi:hypothetical protein